MSDDVTARAGQYVFVSYASADRARVEHIVETLESAGIDMWIDVDGIAGGTQYGSEIGEGIRGSLAVALMCSPASLASRNVKQEIMLAWKHSRPYLPMLLDRVNFPPDLEYWLEGAQWIEILDHPDEVWLPRVLAAVQRVREQVAAARPITSALATDPVSPVRSTLPVAPPLIGRRRELAEIIELVRSGTEQIVTLTGPGGTGKSRLALAAATRLAGEFRQALFVGLAGLDRPELVLPAIAQAVDVREDVGKQLLLSVIDALRGTPTVLLLDNFEHLLSASGIVGQLVDACPELRVLVTSRARLSLYAEQEVPVPPLSLPDLKHLPQRAELARIEAVALFMQRAQVAKPDFRLTDENAQAVSELCVRLDGLPLAIELAAARSRLLTPAAMLARMASVLPLLGGGDRGQPERQQTLRNTIVWSYDLLADDDRRLYRRLSVFRGGWTLEAAEALAGASEHEPLGPDVVLGLERLAESSLLRQDERVDGIPRFQMLETIREFGTDQLAESGEDVVIRQRHAGWYRDLASEEYERKLKGSDHAEWLNRIDLEIENLRAAIEWAVANDPELGGQTIIYLRNYVEGRGLLATHRGWCEAALGSADRLSVATHAGVLSELGYLLNRFGDFEQGLDVLTQAIDTARRAGDDGRLYLAASLLRAGIAHRNAGRPDSALLCYEDAAAAFQSLGNVRMTAAAIENAAIISFDCGDLDRAESYYRDALTIVRDLDEVHDEAHILGNYSQLSVERGDFAATAEYLRRCLDVYRQYGDEFHATFQLANVGDLAVRCGRSHEGLLLISAGIALLDKTGFVKRGQSAIEAQSTIDRARCVIPPDVWQATWDEGAKLEYDAALDLALQICDEITNSRDVAN